MMCLPLGHGHEELTETLREQAGRFVHENSWYSNPQIVAFAEALTATLPDGLDVVNFTVTGSEANEVAMRMALGASGKHDIISVIRGLHGGSLAVEGLTSIGGARRRNLGPLLPPANAPAIHAPLCWRCPINLTYPDCGVACLAASEDLIDRTTGGDAAAIIAETILVAGGMIVPPKEWLPGLKSLAERHGAFLVLDEAQLAPARTGKMWAFEHYDVVPDMVTFAKGYVGRPRHLRRGNAARHRRGSARTRRHAVGRHLLRRSAAGGRGAKAARNHRARQFDSASRSAWGSSRRRPRAPLPII